MKKKILSIIAILFMAIFSINLSADAVITSEGDVIVAARKLNNLAHYDMMSMVSKNQLIGNRYSGFKMATSQYQRSVASDAYKLQNILQNIQVVNNSIDLSDTEKNMQIMRLYQDADITVSKVVSDSMNYLFSLKDIMPTITYSKYVKSFKKYYESLNISPQPLNVY